METIKYKYNEETGTDYCQVKFEFTTERLITPEDYHRLKFIIIEEIQKLAIIKQ
jgi:hypothetical protein